MDVHKMYANWSLSFILKYDPNKLFFSFEIAFHYGILSLSLKWSKNWIIISLQIIFILDQNEYLYEKLSK